MAMPEIGFDEVPMRPAMREETVTKRKPKTTTRRDAMRLAKKPVGAPGTGLKVRKAHMSTTITAEPARTSVIGRSCEVRPPLTGARASVRRRSEAPARSAPTMVGVVLISVMSPAAATAPAPM